MPISSDYIHTDIHTSFFKTGKTSCKNALNLRWPEKAFCAKLEGFPVLPAQCGEDKQVIVIHDSAKACFFLFHGHKYIKLDR